MSRPVDVAELLNPAVHDPHSGEIVGEDEDLKAARDAFLELIECISQIPRRESGLPKTDAQWRIDDESMGWNHAFFGHDPRKHPSNFYQAGLEKGRRLRNALARVHPMTREQQAEQAGVRG